MMRGESIRNIIKYLDVHLCFGAVVSHIDRLNSLKITFRLCNIVPELYWFTSIFVLESAVISYLEQQRF